MRRTHTCAHVYILCIYIYICVYVYVYTHTNTRVSATHPPGRSLILLRIFGWIEAKGEEMIPLSPSRPHLGHVPFTNKASGGVFFFFFLSFFLEPLFLSCLRLISRVITNGDTRISDRSCVPDFPSNEEPLCVIHGRGSCVMLLYFLFNNFLRIVRKWCSGKNIACSRTPLFRNIFE